ncbi:MAG: hypothetical protein KC912_19845 [Proteobacteria bacterium]|nr:hypothetical protein [Pseudomonadota bacterium]
MLYLAVGLVVAVVLVSWLTQSSDAEERAEVPDPVSPGAAEVEASSPALPADLVLLRRDSARLAEWTGYQMVEDAAAAPWSDFSYLTAADLARPDVVANVAAMREVMTHITFVATHEDGRYLGYWHGLAGRELHDSPVVLLDSEGQFSLVGQSLCGALLTEFYDDEERFEALDAWFAEAGLDASMEPARDEDPPGAVHDRLAAVEPPAKRPLVVTQTRGSIGDPEAPYLTADLEHYEDLGHFEVLRMIGLGDVELDRSYAAKPGRWYAYVLRSDALAALRESDAVEPDAHAQVVLVHESLPEPTAGVRSWSVGPGKFAPITPRLSLGPRAFWDAVANDTGTLEAQDGRVDGGLHFVLEGSARIWHDQDEDHCVSIMVIELR